jgi:hypothetical protein
MDKNKLLKVFKELKELGIEFTTYHYENGWMGISPEELLNYYEIGNRDSYWAKKLNVATNDFKNYKKEKFYGVQCCAITGTGRQCKNNVDIYDHDIYEYIEAKKNNNFLCKIHNKLTDIKNIYKNA